MRMVPSLGGPSSSGKRMALKGCHRIVAVVGVVFCLIQICGAYSPGDFVPMSRRGQYHNSLVRLDDAPLGIIYELCRRRGQTGTKSWDDIVHGFSLIRRLAFPLSPLVMPGFMHKVVLPVPKPIGYTNSDEYKLSFEFGREKFMTPWLLVIGRQSTEVPMLDVTLKHTGGDLVGMTAKVVNMPNKYVETHPQIRKEFWDVNVWPKHILVRYIWEDKSETNVEAFFYVLFGWAFFMTLVTSLTILQSSKDKIARFVQDNIVETNVQGPVPKVE